MIIRNLSLAFAAAFALAACGNDATPTSTGAAKSGTAATPPAQEVQQTAAPAQEAQPTAVPVQEVKLVADRAPGTDAPAKEEAKPGEEAKPATEQKADPAKTETEKKPQ